MILITDGLWRKSLGAVRSLGRAGFDISVGEMTPLCTSFFSRYCKQRFVYPSPRTRPAEFTEFILDKLRSGDYEAIFPMEEETLLLLGKERDAISKLTIYPFTENDKIEAVRDKARLMKTAAEAGFPVPKTIVVAGAEELKERIDEIPIPAVVKPRISSGARGIEYVEERDQILPAYKKVDEQYNNPIIQEYIPGESYGVPCLGDGSGGMPAVFIHRRIRSYPVKGGSSTLAESDYSEDLIGLASGLIEHLRWYGVAMLEFRRDERDGKFKLLEMNPRFWGTTALPTACGVNFPLLLYRMAKGEKISPVRKWKTGVRARWLFPGEILHFLNSGQARKDWKNFFKKPGDEYIDLVADPEDPWPALGKLLSSVNFLIYPELKKFIRRT
ncbi:MAG: ATP-grasp domain-containing protein [Chloroflexi bacterium]|nr:ATP-grasp domain-containing protein [Chloroflexota bacterium]